MKRMLDDYVNRLYNKLAARSARLKENDFAKAKEIAAWKEEVVEHWDSFEAVSVRRLMSPAVHQRDGSKARRAFMPGGRPLFFAIMSRAPSAKAK